MEEDGKPLVLTRSLGPGIGSVWAKHSHTSPPSPQWMPHFSPSIALLLPAYVDLFPQLFLDGQQLSTFALGHLAVPCSLCVA